MEHYLAKWTQRRYNRYKILYLAFHGRPGEILIGEQRKAGGSIPLSSLAQVLTRKCKGRMMKLDKRRLKSFLRATGAIAMCGYSDDVDWMKSAAFELLAIQAMQASNFTVSGANKIQEQPKQLARGMGLEFRMVIND